MFKRLAGSSLALCLLAPAALAGPDPAVRLSVAVCDPNSPATCQGNTPGIYSARLPLTASAAALKTATWASPGGGSSAPTVLTNGLVCKAPSTNTGTVYVGPSGVSSSNGYTLAPGEAISFGPTSAGNIYALDVAGGDVLLCAGS